MRDVTKESIELNPFYEDLVKKQDFSPDDLSKLDDITQIPYIPAVLFKQSNEMYGSLLKIPSSSSEFET
jgi:phenylacetate-coenzyme A ligase PaaK-like adenylate-forming protein